MASKTVPTITRTEFATQAKALEVQIDGSRYIAVPKDFSTGSLGWNISGKTVVLIDGKPVECQIGLNVTVIGSKELPK